MQNCRLYMKVLLLELSITYLKLTLAGPGMAYCNLR